MPVLLAVAGRVREEDHHLREALPPGHGRGLLECLSDLLVLTVTTLVERFDIEPFPDFSAK